MQRFSRRTSLTAGVTPATGSAGCLSDGDEPTPPPGIDTIAGSTTPGSEQPLPSPVAGGPDADVTVAAHEDDACPHCVPYSPEGVSGLASDYPRSEAVRCECHGFPTPVDGTRIEWNEPVKNAVEPALSR